MKLSLKKAVLTLIIIGMSSGTVYADYTVASLLTNCKVVKKWVAAKAKAQKKQRSVQATAAGVCLGYINGIFAGQQASGKLVNKVFKAKKLKMKYKSPYCIPSSVKVSQISQVLIKALDGNAAIQQQPAGPWVLEAVTRKWPCSR